MRPFSAAALVVCVGLTVSACKFPGLGQSASTPKGQVVATVDGQEVTLRELNAELSGANFADPKQRKAAEQQALQSIVNRMLLAKAAHSQGLDKGPDFAVRRQKALDLLLAQTLQESFVAAVPPTTRDEAQRFIANRPDIFGDRKILEIDQIQAQGPIDDAKLKELQPLDTMEQVVGWLQKYSIPFRRAPAQIDPISVDPKVFANILKLPPNAVFVVPSGNTLLINRVTNVRPAPVTGDAANNLATQYLSRQHTQEAVGRQMQAIIAKDSQKVVYNPAYAPPPRPKPAPAAPSAPGPAAASSSPPATSR